MGVHDAGTYGNRKVPHKPSQADLLREIEVPWGQKPYSKLPTETILTHMVLEGMIHYGELTASIWQVGLEPPYTAYWRFMHQTRQI